MSLLRALCLLMLVCAGTPASARDLLVSRTAAGAHRSVQAAIDALPESGGTIRIAPGQWREKLNIAKPHVTLIGAGRSPGATVLVYGDSAKSAGGTFKSATVTASGDDLHVTNLTIQNDWWLNPANPPSQAVALSLTGDRAVITRVRLLGHQDTLFANKGPGNRMARQYFSDCYIEGHVDFIFGNAKAYFRNCRIHGLAHSNVMYTAQSRALPEEDSAYVFDHCRLTADPGAEQVSLGRSWRDYATVVFLNTRMDAPVIPEGWREWYPGTSHRLATSYYAEYRSSGRGANPKKRVATSHQLSRGEAAKWSLEAFFKGDTRWTLKQSGRAADRASADPVRRAADLVARMTLEEKAAQIQHAAPAIPRLGVPAYNWWSEGLHGVARAGEATVFPQAIGLAATWDTALMQSVGDVIATEFRAKYLAARKPDGSSGQYRGLTVWSPNVNIFRDPRWGRGQETYGEDPYLTSRMGVAFIRGLQGDDPMHPKTVVAVKHFAVHSGPEASRHADDIHPSPRDVTETYLPAFHAAITEARAQALMCAYNAIDGVPACGNVAYLRDTLRRDWKFGGHIVSDCAAVADFYLPTSHHHVKTPEAAVASAIKAGIDLICDFAANKTADPQVTVNAVRQGLLREAELDAGLRRLFEARFRLGTLDPAGEGPFAAIGPKDFDTPAHRAASLDAARKSLVLLKNDGLLPLKAPPRRIALIGPNADSVEALVGNYNGTPSRPRTLLTGLRTRFPDAEITYVEGTGWVAPPLEDVPDTAFCVDAACSRQGLTIEDFANPRFEGAPSLTKVDANAVYRWGWPTRQERDGTVRWTGYIKPDESGRYRFRYTGDAGCRIFIDDKLIADVWDIAWPTSDTQVELIAGKPVKLRIEAAQKGQRGEQRFRWSRPSAAGDRAMAAARDADLIVFAGGLTARLEGEEMRVAAPGFAGGDGTSLDLPEPQQKLLEALHTTGKPVVLVLMNGSPMSVNWADRNLPAIVEAWYPGGEGGDAIAQLIAGDFSPSGRLPITFYRSADQLPAFTDYSMDGRTYRRSATEPLYPFGHGLSYSRFVYGNPVLSNTRVRAGQPVRISVEVRNEGGHAADEVVQLYSARSVPGAPIRSLVAFQRISLRPGERRSVTFAVSAAAMSTVNSKGDRIVEPGTVKFWLGGGQPLARPGMEMPAGVSAALRVSGRKSLPRF